MIKSQTFFTMGLILIIVMCCTKKQGNIAFSLNDVPIHFDVMGAGEPALVFVHGWSRDRRDWEYQLPYFAQKHMVVAIDLAGHGQSGRDRNDWTIPAFSQDVMAVVEKLQLQRIVLIGHSMGAPVVLETARRIPGRVIAIVPVDSFHDVEEKFTQEQIDRILEPYRLNFVETYARVARQILTDSAQIEKSIRQIETFSPEIGIASFEQCQHYMSKDLIPGLQDVKAPIICINSDQTPTKLDVARRYAPSFDALAMTGVGHEMQNGDPDQFNRLLERVLSGLSPAAVPPAPAEE